MRAPAASTWGQWQTTTCKGSTLPSGSPLIPPRAAQHTPRLSLLCYPQVPFLLDGEVGLPESAAIMAYLSELYQLPEQWHPATAASSSTGRDREGALRKRALFDAATHWQHLTIRRGCMTYAFATVIGGWGASEVGGWRDCRHTTVVRHTALWQHSWARDAAQLVTPCAADKFVWQ